VTTSGGGGSQLRGRGERGRQRTERRAGEGEKGRERGRRGGRGGEEAGWGEKTWQ